MVDKEERKIEGSVRNYHNRAERGSKAKQRRSERRSRERRQIGAAEINCVGGALFFKYAIVSLLSLLLLS